ncbi:Uma2 family endonuclease [Nostoc sp. LPT]|uniref:Uma2 family endonuclease n=1 Tax=Nostoc sp. LPT TaxID=2815387 RepID=UPI0025E49A9D|nr:Uma2 family endonuclease [Nostoc sp. LPT]
MTQTRVRLWNVDEYHLMLETGIIAADERVELIEGQVIPISAKNSPHAAITLCASDYLKRSLVEVALVRVQNPIQLSQYSEPEPDIAKILLPHFPTAIILSLNYISRQIRTTKQLKTKIDSHK